MNNSGEHYLGISLSQHDLVFAETSPTSERVEIHQLASLRMEKAFDYEALPDEGTISIFAETIESALQMRNVHAGKVSLSLPDHMAIIKLFPIDAQMDDASLREHLQWEVEQFLLADQSEYVKDFQHLPVVAGGQNQMMLVAVRKILIDFVKAVFAKTRTKLVNIDLDMFSAVRAVEANYEFRPQSKAILIQFETASFKVLQLYEGKFLGFEEFTFILGDNKNESGSVSLLTEEVYKKIDQVLSIYFNGNDQSDLDRILIFGRSIPSGLIDELQELCPAPVDTVNPFNKIRLSTQAEQSRGTHDLHDFLIAVGTALRGVRS